MSYIHIPSKYTAEHVANARKWLKADECPYLARVFDNHTTEGISVAVTSEDPHERLDVACSVLPQLTDGRYLTVEARRQGVGWLGAAVPPDRVLVSSKALKPESYAVCLGLLCHEYSHLANSKSPEGGTTYGWNLTEDLLVEEWVGRQWAYGRKAVSAVHDFAACFDVTDAGLEFLFCRTPWAVPDEAAAREVVESVHWQDLVDASSDRSNLIALLDRGVGHAWDYAPGSDAAVDCDSYAVLRSHVGEKPSKLIETTAADEMTSVITVVTRTVPSSTQFTSSFMDNVRESIYTGMGHAPRIPQQLTGELDQSRLYAAAYSANLFSLDTTAKTRGEVSLDLLLLADESGSTNGDLAGSIREAVNTIYHSFQHLFPKSRLRIAGYSGHAENRIYDYYDSERDGEPEGTIYTSAKMENYDGFAIRWAKAQLSETNGVPVLCVLSDGDPCGKGYHEDPAMRDTRQAIKSAEESGICVVGVNLATCSLDKLYTRKMDFQGSQHFCEDFFPELLSLLDEVANVT